MLTEKQLNKALNQKFNNIIKSLESKDADKYDVSDLMDKALKLVSFDDVDCDTTTPLLDNDVASGQALVSCLENSLGGLEDIGCTHGKPTEQQAIEAGNVGQASVENLQSNLAFVENNFEQHGLNWYITLENKDDPDNTDIAFLDRATALDIVKSLKADAVVYAM